MSGRVLGVIPRWSNLSLRLKILAVMSVPIIALIASSMTFLQAGESENKAEDAATEAVRIRQGTQDVQTALDALDASLWLEMYPALASAAPNAQNRLDSAIGNLKTLLAGNQQQLAKVAEFESLLTRKIEFTREQLAIIGKIENLEAALKNVGPAEIAQFAAITEAPKRALAGIAHEAEDALTRHAKEVDDARARGVLVVIVAGATGVAGGLVFMFIAFTGIVRRIRRVGENAGRLAEGRALKPIPPSGDEVGLLAVELQEAAALLAEREAGLRAASEQAQRANEAKSEFLSRMSHELRTPLNSILGFGQVLASEDLSQSNREDVNYILKAGRHLLGLIDEVLDLSRIEAGGFRTSIEPVRLKDVLTEVTDLTRPLADEREISVTTSGADLWVEADRQRLKQVLLNLVANAIKFNKHRGTVAIQTRPNGHGVAIDVCDTGRGIPKDQIDRLFVPFERLDAAETEVEGTGLGLALSQRLTEAMGGSIEVDSKVGVGSVFSVCLKRADAIAMPEEDEPAEAAAPSGMDPLILYVEDNVANLHLVERIVAGRAVRLVSAMKGTLALDLAKLHRPDVILLDLHLPDMPGEKVLEYLKADARTSTIPVVVISADATPASIARAIEGGADRYLTKPLDVNAFLEALESILSMRSVA